MSARILLTPILCALAASCISYDEDRVDVALIADEVQSRVGGPLTVTQALDLGLRQNPELRALEAKARAAGAETTVPIDVLGELRGRNEAIGAMIDPIALLGLGPRGSVMEAAEARHAQALAELAVARWRDATAIVECFLIDAELAALTSPELDIDVDAFVTAGLASPVAASQLRATVAMAASERLEIERARIDNLATLRHLLGLDRNAPLELLPIDDDYLQQPQGEDRELLDRPDLALAAARFEVRDAEFRNAVAEQYPSLQIGPNISLRGDPLRAMGMFRIPFGMQGLAEAARERRQAARDDLEDAFLEAGREATKAEQQLTAAVAATSAAELALRANATSFAAARTALEVEVDAFGPFVRTAREWLDASRAHRNAVVPLARARIARAAAFGWPRSATASPEQDQ